MSNLPNKNQLPEEDDEPFGLMCVPPGMSAQQVNDFNTSFRALSEVERQATIQSIVNAAVKGGATVINIDLEKPKPSPTSK
jgi:hypothetical protein